MPSLVARGHPEICAYNSLSGCLTRPVRGMSGSPKWPSRKFPARFRATAAKRFHGRVRLDALSALLEGMTIRTGYSRPCLREGGTDG